MFYPMEQKNTVVSSLVECMKEHNLIMWFIPSVSEQQTDNLRSSMNLYRSVILCMLNSVS